MSRVGGAGKPPRVAPTNIYLLDLEVDQHPQSSFITLYLFFLSYILLPFTLLMATPIRSMIVIWVPLLIYGDVLNLYHIYYGLCPST